MVIKRIFALYQYLFYKFYALYYWMQGGQYWPEQIAIAFISLMGYVNALALLIILQYFTGYGFDQVFKSNQTLLCFAGLFILINYHIFMRDKKYLKIAKKYSHETTKESLLGTLYVLIYIIMSVLVFIPLKYLYQHPLVK